MLPKLLILAVDVNPILLHVVKGIGCTVVREKSVDILIGTTRVAALLIGTVAAII